MQLSLLIRLGKPRRTATIEVISRNASHGALHEVMGIDVMDGRPISVTDAGRHDTYSKTVMACLIG
jgi:hypothetical protein